MKSILRKSPATVVTILLSLVARICLAEGVVHKAAIADISDDTRPFMKQLKASGVVVIGRYLGRCPQWPGKRIIENGPLDDPTSEIAQLVSARFGLFSIYQYNSNSPLKFVGRDKTGQPLAGADCKKIPGEPGSRQPIRSPEEEGRLDANAAVQQAEALKQPKHSAIYFGVDFPIVAGSEDIGNMRRYFAAVHTVLQSHAYEVGVYGSGLANETIKADKHASFFWIAASRSFDRTTHFHNSKQWTLFQDTVDQEWFGERDGEGHCRKGLGVETDIQNTIDKNYAGFWRPDELFKIEENRVSAILKSSRFVCSGTGLLFASKTGLQRPSGEVCYNKKSIAKPIRIDYGQSLRTGSIYNDRTEVDVDDDGVYDGWIRNKELTHDYFSKPEWIEESSKRQNAKCPAAE